MKPEEQRIALAAAFPERLKYFGGSGWHYGVDNEDWRRCVGGDVLNDLNAVAVLEDKIPEHLWSEYERNLTIIATGNVCAIPSSRKIISAKSDKRCKALLKTLGLWKD